MSLVAQELPQLPEPPAQVQEMPTSIMEEAEQVTTSLLPGSDIPTAAIIDVDKTEPIKQIQNAPSEFQVPTPPVMETPKTADQDRKSVV